ncbi:protein phosphatase 2C domain-containing protein [Paenibacillus qinlingensis]|uniref:Serine/threonine protein phosphatase PrpC n=1 Tax=Paenibacillus qinlingensis TaxID=1837343 RepID=A0ABU1NNS4_9BACL|nr:protein phosphatase 2C domain-containing protein [Paenibacillus qinlingensis]MDR6549131.1 serine/threonine protein phosphatase PrpC [Paenibacillus qinlingensis]
MKTNIKMQAVSRQGNSAWNEDSLLVNDNLHLYGVIDGATSLEPYRGVGGETGGYLAAQSIAKSIREMSQDNVEHQHSPQDLLLQANQQLRTEMLAAGVDVTRKEQLWGACAVIVRVHKTFVEYAHSGDCMLIAVYEDDTIRIITRDQLEVVDRPTRQLWAQGVASGLTSRDDLWELVKPQIHAGRALMNTPNGYSVLNGEPELADYMEFGRISRTQLKSLLLFSDGLVAPQRELSLEEEFKQIVSRVTSMGLDNYIEWLIQVEEADPDCLQFPRVKKSDDKTAIYLEF